MPDKEAKKPAKAATKAKTAKPKAPASEASPAPAAEEVAAPAATEAAAPEAAVTEAPKAAKKPVKAKKEEAPAAEAPKENLSLNPDDVEKPKIVKAKGSKNVHTGIAHVLSTFNNTIVTITDLKGKCDRLGSSAGSGRLARARARPTLLKWWRRMLRDRPWAMVSRKSKCWSKALEPGVNQPCALCKRSVSSSP